MIDRVPLAPAMRYLILPFLPLWLTACGSSGNGAGDNANAGALGEGPTPAGGNTIGSGPAPPGNATDGTGAASVAGGAAAGSSDQTGGGEVNAPIGIVPTPAGGSSSTSNGSSNNGTSGTGGSNGASGACQASQVSANEVVWIGDSWIDIPGNQKTRVNELARAAGVIGQNESFVDLAVSGSPIATIVNQYNNREAGATKIKVLLMDGGGIDTIQGGGSQASVTNVVNAFTRHLAKVASDGTVENIVYYLYPELPTIAGVAALRPGVQAACAASSVPCHFLDLQPLWQGHPEFTGGDNIHPSQAGANVIAEALWAIMEENCIAQ